MDDLAEIIDKSDEYCAELQLLAQGYMEQVRVMLWGPQGAKSSADDEIPLEDLSRITPQQTKKRIKRLSSLNESEENGMPPSAKVSPPRSTRTSNSELLATACELEMEEEMEPDVPHPVPQEIVELPVVCSTKEIATTETELMPPPPMPEPSISSSIEQSELQSSESFTRPKRAAKLRSEKSLKEPKLNQKLRRPSNFDKPTVKLENEQRPSQMGAKHTESTRESEKSEDSVIALPTKVPSIVELDSEDDKISDRDVEKPRKLVVKVKREKLSNESSEPRSSQEAQAEKPEETPPAKEKNNITKPVPMPKVAVKNERISVETTITSSTLSATITSKKGKKKKIGSHKPIKVERFSDIDNRPMTRTRNGGVRNSGGSVYEDAVDHMAAETTNIPVMPRPVATATGINETVTIQSAGKPNATLADAPPNDATFCANVAQTTFQIDVGQATFVMDSQNANATVTIDKKAVAMGDATFNITPKNVTTGDMHNSAASSQHSMETAKDTTQCQHDSLITEDESLEPEKPDVLINKLPNPKPSGTLVKVPSSTKAFKMPARTNELFNPLVQSPVKKKVEAFENAAIAELSKSGRPKRTKENAAPSTTTPTIGKLAAPLGRFLTPTQASNLTPGTMANVKKGPSSASKAMAFPKAGTTLTKTKTLSRENSADDFRKGLHNLAEERKKQREQKHLLVAQQREAKERERAERMAKLNKEREEKRLKKQQEAEQKKRALEEIQRNLRQQEEAAAAAEAAKLKAAKAKAIAEQERELLQQLKQNNTRAATKMLPPPPKVQSKYAFEMLHEDDSTDEEDKTSYKRPPPPNWSRSNVRGPAIRAQQHWPTKIIDSFFSVQPMSPDLRAIFPNIGSHHLKRNSSAMWSTPPRYSELPKY